MKKVRSYPRYLNNICNKCYKQITDFSHTPTAENLHQLRINLKKIRALLRLIKECEPAFKFKKHYKPFKTIFKQSGKIREGHVYLAMFGKLPADFRTAELQQQKNIIGTQTKVFRQKREAYKRQIKKGSRKPEKHLRKLKSKDVKHYFYNFLNRLESESLLLNASSKLHPFRKTLKELQYNAGLLNTKSKLYKNIKPILTAGNKMEDTIGKWHDKELLIQELKQHKTPKKQKAYSKEIRQLSKENDAEVIQIETMLNRFKSRLNKAVEKTI